ncbi:hypothetical protein [Streptomyces sp. AK02-01A]|uniref:hypothetical protein n=1 Tax=Streptomyces sp. AK02-01A TaxID=3028648 RepID=UPI0029A115C7|nr:hypothetical protein [Streptomyces sp. AK02-01A]MDX3851174.1 hypothetical protein [Streptomyces sp. AK02-01A]
MTGRHGGARAALLVLSLLLSAPALTGCGAEQTPAARYEDGYRFGRDEGPAGHLGGGGEVSLGAAESECGEHAETDGVDTNAAWMDGCTDAARGLPARPE